MSKAVKTRVSKITLGRVDRETCVLDQWQTVYRWHECILGFCKELGNQYLLPSAGAEDFVVVMKAVET